MTENDKLPLYELTIEDFNYDGCTAISIVEFPAIEESFMVFSKQMEKITMSKPVMEKKLIVGPSLVANKQIYRMNPLTGEEYFVYFSEETIKKISEDFLIKNRNHNITLEHSTNVNDVSIVESWIVEDSTNDKSNALGWNLPKGSWMISLKFNNDEVWDNYVKTGKVTGISIEGFFTTLFDKYSKEIKEEPKEEPKAPELTEDEIILNKIKDILKELDIDDKKN